MSAHTDILISQSSLGQSLCIKRIVEDAAECKTNSKSQLSFKIRSMSSGLPKCSLFKPIFLDAFLLLTSIHGIGIFLCAWSQVQNLLCTSWSSHHILGKVKGTWENDAWPTQAPSCEYINKLSVWSLSSGTVPYSTLLPLTVQEIISLNNIHVLKARILSWNKWWNTLFYNSSLCFSSCWSVDIKWHNRRSMEIGWSLSILS